MKLTSILGNTINNIILDFFLNNHPLDFSVPNISKQTKISSVKVYRTIDSFVNSGILKKTRRMNAQYYGINTNSKKGKIILQIKTILDEGGQK